MERFSNVTDGRSGQHNGRKPLASRGKTISFATDVARLQRDVFFLRIGKKPPLSSALRHATLHQCLTEYEAMLVSLAYAEAEGNIPKMV